MANGGRALINIVRQNLVMKLIALVTAVVIWLYATADRLPREAAPRTVRADVTRIGTPPADLIVHVRQDSVAVQVTGPKAEVDALSDGEIHAEVSLTNVRADTTQLRVRYKAPPAAPDLQIDGQPTVAVDVAPKVRRAMRITAVFNDQPPPGTTFGAPMIVPQRAYVIGSEAAVERVTDLVVYLETGGSSVRADLPVEAIDKDAVQVRDVAVEPATARVELSLRQAPASRTLVVDPVVQGKPQSPLAVAGVTAEPGEVSLSGRADQLPAMANIPTEPVDITGVTADTTREARLVLPSGVTVRGGSPVVRVLIRVRDTSKPPGQ